MKTKKIIGYILLLLAFPTICAICCDGAYTSGFYAGLIVEGVILILAFLVVLTVRLID